jgi:hypothetical protein
MHLTSIGVVCLATVVACHSQRSAPAAASSPQASRSVFADSALHVELCEPLKQGEDWRKVCTPKDQSARPTLKPTIKPP